MGPGKDSSVEIYTVDAFTSQRFKGNPAGVCIPEDQLPDSLCLAIAAEMNLSETAFTHSVPRLKDDIPRFGLRWFTPKVEVDLCGHATLATAKVLFQEIGIDSEVLAFDTRSGPLFAHRDGTAIRIDLPANPPEPLGTRPAVLEPLGVPDLKNMAFSPQTRKLLVEVDDEATVRAVNPDFKAMLSAQGPPDIKGVIVTAKGGEAIDDEPAPDFVSRFFAPWWGVDEDPVTGAAHTVLAPYWSNILGKGHMNARQVSARGGELGIGYRKDDGRVALTGEAVIVLDGSIRLD